jgi:threonyl-tRNA synthetase
MNVPEPHLEKARELADKVRKAQIRVGLDDRSEAVGKKVREAKQDWVGYAIVIGDKEMTADVLTVYDRSQNKNVEMTVDQLIERVRGEIGDMPFRPMYLPSELSRRVDM